MGGACSTYGGKERCYRFVVGKHLEDQDIDGRIILRWIFRKLYGERGGHGLD